MGKEDIATLGSEALSRAIIDQVNPTIDDGKFPAKATVGSPVHVDSVLLCDSHEKLQGQLCYRLRGDSEWTREDLTHKWNDHWFAQIPTEKPGYYEFKIEASIDRLGGWLRDYVKKAEASVATAVDLQVGIDLLEQIATRADSQSRKYLAQAGKYLQSRQFSTFSEPSAIKIWAQEFDILRHAGSVQDERSFSSSKVFNLVVEIPKAAFSSWYEFFPRSTNGAGHGTFTTSLDRLKYAASLGFDVVYLPPIHPIGLAYRKGPNNGLTASANDVGSPWAIGSSEGGHKDIHPELGSMADFKEFVDEAAKLGIDVALDIALQCSPDHPYVKSHPDWFIKRPDGSIQYAENPPKKYQDIYPINFECEDWNSLWEEMASIFLYWCKLGIRIFRVDNPHTKPFKFWDSTIAKVKAAYPETVFLAEAFTRPHRMERLAKGGFSQSYTYFTWRVTKDELTEYVNELNSGSLPHTMRPSFWPNTPDILPEHLQTGGRTAFMQRAILASTLSSNWGIYGPAFELCEHRAVRQGSEEYLDSEKYQIRSWDLDASQSIAPLIKRLNRIRKTQPVLQQNQRTYFVETTSDQLIAYLKYKQPDYYEERHWQEAVLIIVNLDPYNRHAGEVILPLFELDIDEHEPFLVHDEISDATYTWQGRNNYVELDPSSMPGHILTFRSVANT